MKMTVVSQARFALVVLIPYVCCAIYAASTPPTPGNGDGPESPITVVGQTTTITSEEEVTTAGVIGKELMSTEGYGADEMVSTTLEVDLETTTAKPTTTSTTTKKPSRKKIYFPQDVELCSAKNPKLDNCFKEAANKMIKYLRPGRQHLGVLPLDPLWIPLVSLPRNNVFLPSLAFNATDIKQHGWANAVLTDASIDLKNHIIYTEFYFPVFRLEGRYSAVGKLLEFIPLSGEGDFEIKLDEARIGVTLQGHEVPRRSAKYLSIDRIFASSNFGRIHIELSNLFGDKQLSDLTNALINQNSDLVVKKAGPAIEAVLAELYRGLLQRFFYIVPWNTLFKDLSN